MARSPQNFDWRDDQITLREATLGSDFSVDERQLKLNENPRPSAGWLHYGDAEFTNWLTPQPATAPTATQPSAVREAKEKEKKPEEAEGVLRLRLKDISAGAVAAALSTRQYPLDRLNLAGTTDGTIDIRWTGSLRRAETEFVLNLVPPPVFKPRDVPVTASARGAYRADAGRLELAQFDLFTAPARSTPTVNSAPIPHCNFPPPPATYLSCSRWSSPCTARPPSRHAARKRAFQRHASGKLSAPSLVGHLQIEDFDALIPATDRAPSSPSTGTRWPPTSNSVSAALPFVTPRPFTVTPALASTSARHSRKGSSLPATPSRPTSTSRKPTSPNSRPSQVTATPLRVT